MNTTDLHLTTLGYRLPPTGGPFLVDHGSHLAIAKFPNKGDEVNTVVWEAVALTLAENAGSAVPEWRLETIAGALRSASSSFGWPGRMAAVSGI